MALSLHRIEAAARIRLELNDCQVETFHCSLNPNEWIKLFKNIRSAFDFNRRPSRCAKLKNQKGFTLVELMVTVSVIAILAAIAIPQFARYREKAFNSASENDLYFAIVSQERYFIDFGYYTPNVADLFETARTKNTSLLVDHADQIYWAGRSWHRIGTRTYCYNNQLATNNTITFMNGTAQNCS